MDNDLNKVVPKWVYLLLTPFLVPLILTFTCESAPLWSIYLGYAGILATAIVATYYFYKAKAYERIVLIWICIIIMSIPLAF